jgi:hypothetical protein
MEAFLRKKPFDCSDLFMIEKMSMHLLWCAVEKLGELADDTIFDGGLHQRLIEESNQKRVSQRKVCRSVTSQSGSHGYKK